MFGHLRVRRRGLTCADRERYQAQFCGGCQALRELGGRAASLLTNYDQALLYLVYAALESTHTPRPIALRSCTGVPFRQVPVQSLSPQGRSAVAALTILLV